MSLVGIANETTIAHPVGGVTAGDFSPIVDALWGGEKSRAWRVKSGESPPRIANETTYKSSDTVRVIPGDLSPIVDAFCDGPERARYVERGESSLRIAN